MEHSSNLGTPVYTPETITRIYGLIDPRTGLIRYVGRTKRKISRRLRNHMKDARRELPTNHRIKWLKKLISLDIEPSIVLIEECHGDGIKEECFHIAIARSDGLKLVNSTGGGEGPMWISDDLRERLSVAAKGRKHTDEVKAICAAASRARVRTPEQIEAVRRLGRANVQRAWSPDSRAKASASKRGKKFSPERCRAMSEARKGKPWSAARRANPATNNGLKFTDEQRRRISEANKGRKATNRRFDDATEAAICQKYKDIGHCSATKTLATEYNVTHYLITSILRRHGIPSHSHSLLPDQIEKMRASKMGTKQSAETIEKRFKNIRGIKRKPFTEEHRRKLSESHKGKKQSPGTIQLRVSATLATKKKAKRTSMASDTFWDIC